MIDIRFILKRRNFAIGMVAPNVVNLSYKGRSSIAISDCMAILRELDEKLSIPSLAEVNVYKGEFRLFKADTNHLDMR